MSAPLRRLDFGPVPPLTSQALYHGLGAAMDQATTDSVVFCSPAAPYFCVGYHQTAAEVLDLERCRRAGWPVLRRRIGGGAVYLDAAQLFYQVVVHRSRAPFAVRDIFGRFLAAPVLALRRLGLAAVLRGVNEIEVRGRRIAGTGGGQLGDSIVVVGNILFDFPHAHMTRAWRVPSDPFRRLAGEGLRCHLTTLRRELVEVPSMEGVADLVAQCYAETLERPVVPGTLSPREEAAIARAERELASDTFVLARTPRPSRGLKIARGVVVREATLGTGRGPLRLTVRLRDDVIDAIAVSSPGGTRWVEDLVGARLDPDGLAGPLSGAAEGPAVIDVLLALGREGVETG